MAVSSPFPPILSFAYEHLLFFPFQRSRLRIYFIIKGCAGNFLHGSFTYIYIGYVHGIKAEPYLYALLHTRTVKLLSLNRPRRSHTEQGIVSAPEYTAVEMRGARLPGGWIYSRGDDIGINFRLRQTEFLGGYGGYSTMSPLPSNTLEHKEIGVQDILICRCFQADRDAWLGNMGRVADLWAGDDGEW